MLMGSLYCHVLVGTESLNLCRFSVATVMFSTTVLIAVQIVFVKHLPVVVALVFFSIFGFLDGGCLSQVLDNNR